MATTMSREDNCYFSNVIKFITSYNWIWDVKMTRFFTDNHSINIPQEWREAFKSWKPEDIHRLCDSVYTDALSHGNMVDDITTCHQSSSLCHKDITTCHQPSSLCHKDITTYHQPSSLCHKDITTCHQPSSSHDGIKTCHQSSLCCNDITTCHQSSSLPNDDITTCHHSSSLHNDNITTRHQASSILHDDITICHKLSSLPHSIVDYITTCHQLSLSVTIPDHIKTNEITVDKNIARGMSPKKLHEVSRLAGLVKQVCQEMQCDSVIDVGSGLGYLGTCLVSQCGLNVTCIEGNEDRVDSATTREQRVFRSCDSHMTTVSLTLDSSTETKANMVELITNLSVPRVCLVGLHCCGDLTPILLRLLAIPTHPALTSAVIVSCCYHKMATVSSVSDESMFENFPLSQSLRRAMSCDEGCGSVTPFFNAFALRLAAQESYESWQLLSTDGHLNHMKHVAYRAVLEALLEHTGEKLPGKAHRKANYGSFEEYFTSLNLKGISLDIALKKYEQYSPLFYLIEPFTALQYHMQRVLETLILMDRVVYLRENGLDAELVPVFDVTISPRTFAIVVRRKC